MIRRQIKALLAGSVLICAAAPAAPAKIIIEIDYSLDTNGFFLPQRDEFGNALNPFGFDGVAARAQLDRAAQLFSDRFIDSLSAITPRQGPVPEIQYTWTPGVFHPATGGNHDFLDNPAIPQDVIRVYAGGRDLPGSQLGEGGAGSWGASGLQEWFDEINGRGQAGANATPETDVAPWGGSITFDTATNWHFGDAASGFGLKSDFYSVAVHELAHLLGSGAAGSWDNLVSGNTFTGASSMALAGGPVTLSNDLSHWASGTQSSVGGTAQEAAMDPSLTTGTRKRFTLLDWAGMDDLGWELAGPGDANADGAVNFNDLVALAQNYNNTTGVARWSQGDFNEDGNVTFNDLVLLAQRYGSGGAAAAEVERFGAAFSRDWADALEAAAVPEPGVGGVLGGVAIVLMRRSRRGV